MADEQARAQARAHAGGFLIAGIAADRRPADRELLDFIEEISPFGVILFSRNLPDHEGVLALTGALRRRFPDLALAIDHEGGRVHRLPPPFTRFPPALSMARHGDPGLVREAARAQARELRAAGFDINFAPVLDIHTNPDNPIIGNRAFGTTPEEVIHNALPYLQGLSEGGVLGCAKHFPGHGDTAADSHLELPRVGHDRDRLLSVEMAPFARAIEQGVAMIMTAHVLYDALDGERPASLSKAVVGDILRGRLGYRGVVVSDDLDMKAITAERSVGEAAVEAIDAGSDLVLVCQSEQSVTEARGAIAEAIAEGRLPRATVEAAARRRAKLASRIRKLRRAAPPDPSVIGTAVHRDLAARLA
ncbi:MAG: beta-N-acetylhexosaminidase [Deltaproteobacteria bacterium]|nr:MAG: beta-N-acetylhexosaminidase [Deltaproteobacteria bacterium]